MDLKSISPNIRYCVIQAKKIYSNYIYLIVIRLRLSNGIKNMRASLNVDQENGHGLSTLYCNDIIQEYTKLPKLKPKDREVLATAYCIRAYAGLWIKSNKLEHEYYSLLRKSIDSKNPLLNKSLDDIQEAKLIINNLPEKRLHKKQMMPCLLIIALFEGYNKQASIESVVNYLKPIIIRNDLRNIAGLFDRLISVFAVLSNQYPYLTLKKEISKYFIYKDEAEVLFSLVRRHSFDTDNETLLNPITKFAFSSDSVLPSHLINSLCYLHMNRHKPKACSQIEETSVDPTELEYIQNLTWLLNDEIKNREFWNDVPFGEMNTDVLVKLKVINKHIALFLDNLNKKRGLTVDENRLLIKYKEKAMQQSEVYLDRIMQDKNYVTLNMTAILTKEARYLIEYWVLNNEINKAIDLYISLSDAFLMQRHGILKDEIINFNKTIQSLIVDYKFPSRDKVVFNKSLAYLYMNFSTYQATKNKGNLEACCRLYINMLEFLLSEWGVDPSIVFRVLDVSSFLSSNADIHDEIHKNRELYGDLASRFNYDSLVDIYDQIWKKHIIYESRPGVASRLITESSRMTSRSYFSDSGTIQEANFIVKNLTYIANLEKFYNDSDKDYERKSYASFLAAIYVYLSRDLFAIGADRYREYIVKCMNAAQKYFLEIDEPELYFDFCYLKLRYHTYFENYEEAEEAAQETFELAKGKRGLISERHNTYDNYYDISFAAYAEYKNNHLDQAIHYLETFKSDLFNQTISVVEQLNNSRLLIDGHEPATPQQKSIIYKFLMDNMGNYESILTERNKHSNQDSIDILLKHLSSLDKWILFSFDSDKECIFVLVPPNEGIEKAIYSEPVPLGVEEQLNDIVEWNNMLRLRDTDDEFGSNHIKTQAALKKLIDKYSLILGDWLIDTIGVSDQKVPLIIYPNALLQYFPINALKTTTESPIYIVDQFSISYTPSIRHADYIRLKKHTCDNKFNLIHIHPTEFSSSDHDLPLIGLEKNILKKSVAEECYLSLQQDEVLSNINGDYSDYKTVHISSHSSFNADNPTLSVIQLDAPISTDVAHILPISLQTELVFLSSCESALRSAHDFQQEPDGLPSRFLKLGASSVIGTLWKVKDLPSALMTYTFYKLYKEKYPDSPSMALNHTQQWLRELTLYGLRDCLRQIQQISSEDFPDNLQQFISQETIHEGDQKPFEDPMFWASYICWGK